MAAQVVNYSTRYGFGTDKPTSTQLQHFEGSPRRITAGTVVLNATPYATGGLSADLTLDMNSVEVAVLSATGGYSAEYDAANKKVKIYSAAGTEVTNATNLTLTVHFIVYGH